MPELPIRWQFLGEVPYQDAWQRQKDARQRRIDGESEDQIFLLEHPPTITLGRLRGEESLLHPQEELRRRGVTVLRSDRGGDATLHAPGQLVGYLILDIGARKLALPDFVEAIAGAFVEYLQGFDVDARYDTQFPGVWVGDDKIVAFGFHLHKGVTMHGFAFNLHTDLSLFELLIPCGLQQKGVTSLAHLIGPERTPSCERAAEAIAQAIIQYLSPT